jgi:acetate CoA/acetoacetate CoA-transferase alpha subunit
VEKVTDVVRAVERIPDGARLMIGGFLGVGSPHRLIGELLRQGKKGLTIIANDTGRPELGIGRLVVAKQVRKVIVSHIGTNPETQKQMIAGELDVELVPQGTLAERIRAGGCGLGAVITPTGLGTTIAEGKQTLEINGRTFLIEMPLRADFALLAARRSDYRGNLDYELTARNFNAVMALAADEVIAEPGEIVPIGCITPDEVVTPFVLVDHIVEGERRAYGR